MVLCVCSMMLKTKKQNMCGASLFPFLAGFFVTIVDF